MKEAEYPTFPALSSEHVSSQRNKKGKLKIFFGYARGIGTTYAMLDDAKEQLKSGVDVLVGSMESCVHPDTLHLLEGLPCLPRKTSELIPHCGCDLELDLALIRKPALLIIDTLAYTNASTARNKYRYQDVEELLQAGIDVYTTLFVENIASLQELIEEEIKSSGAAIIPDEIFDNANQIKLIDMEPEELAKRYEKFFFNNVTHPNQEKPMLTKNNLMFLRETAILRITDRIRLDLNDQKSKETKKKILVCVCASTSSMKCVRFGVRLAEATLASLVVVTVDSSQSTSTNAKDKETVRHIMEVSAQLGAEIVTLQGYDKATIIAEYARMNGITSIVLGKNRTKLSLQNCFTPRFENQIIAKLPHTEIHIIPSSIHQKPYQQPHQLRLMKYVSLSWMDGLKTLAILMIATFLGLVLQLLNIGDQNIIMIFILSVLIISRVTTGYVYGIVASILSVLVFNFFFTVPYYTFHARQVGYPITFLIMLLVALITSALTIRIRLQASLVLERERKTDVLYDINKKLLSTRGLYNIVVLTNEYLTHLFQHSVIFYTQDPHHGNKGTSLHIAEEQDKELFDTKEEYQAVHWVFLNHKHAGVGTNSLEHANAYYVPVMSQNNVLGVIGISCVSDSFRVEDRAFLIMIVSQVAMALERQRLSDEQQLLLVESEKEKMRSNLLRAISHDLRTPLTGILGASSAILENGEQLDRATQEKLISNIKEDSQWLIRMVENLLSVTRINADTMNVLKTPEIVEEVVAEAISRVRKSYPHTKISVKVPDEVLEIPMDGTLIEQVLINLLENAIKHSPTHTTIEVVVVKSEEYATFEVRDHGLGIPSQDLPYLFESYVPNGKRSSDSARGMGIGLSICMSIIKAHNGQLRAKNHEHGGATFEFTLPLLCATID